MSNNFKANILSGVKWSTLGTIVRSSFQLLQIAILARFLPKEAFGLVAMSLFVVNFTNIFLDMGFTSAILHRQNATKEEYSTVFWFNLVVSIGLYLIVAGLSPFISDFYDEVELTTLIPILCVNLIFLAVGRIHRTIMQKEFKFRNITLIEGTSSLIGLIIAITLALLNYGVYSLVFSTLAASFVASVLFLITNLSSHGITFYFRYELLKPYFKVGGYSFGSQLISFFSTDIDVLIIGKLLGVEALGLYSLSKELIIKLYTVLNSIFTSVLSPALSSIQGDQNRIKAYYLKSISFISIINVPFYSFMILFSREVLLLLYGNKYVDAYFILICLAVTYFISSISNPVGSLHIATGRTDIGLRWSIISIIVTPLVIYFASVNIDTVAFSRAILSLTMVIIPLWYIQLKPMINIKLGEYVNVLYKPILFLSLLILFVYLLGGKVEIVNDFIFNGIIKGCLLLVSFTLFMMFFERKVFRELISLLFLTIKKKRTANV